MTTISSSRKTRESGRSSRRPWRSSSPRKAVWRPASCARSRRRPWPCASPRVCIVCQHFTARNVKSPSQKIDRHYAPGNNILVLPADLVAETANGAVLAAGLQSEDAESLGNNHLLLLVVRGRDTLEDLESLKSSGTAGGLVGDHATDGLVEDAGRGAEVEGTCLWSESPGSVIRDCIRTGRTHHRG